ncbi:MAG: hypothetical protein FJ299_12180 [Planctomycetes bacterium]|nr:hypothetical protein [Planctomycetota bacterium]
MLLSICLSASVQAPLIAQEESPRDAIIGTPHIVGTQPLDDEIRKPRPAQIEPAAGADRVLAPAGGDPFFLGFAAGAYYPPEGERIDPLLSQFAASLPLDGRPDRSTYGFVMFSKRMTEERVRTLQSLGARAIEFHPFYTLKVALRPERLSELAGLDFVRWVGAPRAWQKLHPDVAVTVAKAPGEKLSVYVNVFESDLCAASVEKVVAQAIESDPDGNVKRGSPAFDAKETYANGWQQKRLEELGVEVGAWIESVRAFRATLRPELLEQLVALDFVQFVDLDNEEEYDHDEGMPMSNADRIRASYDGATSGSCQAGIIDSGLDTGHAAIDPYGVGWDYSGAGNPFDDTNGHGTHTGGTVLGNDDVEDSWQGGAPGLGLDPWRRFFVVRKGSNASFSTWLSVMNSSYFDGTYISPAPMVVSNSYSSNVVTTPFIGSETDPRTIDSNAFSNDQLWIWSASNEGPTAGTCGEESVAKNALTVGNVVDSRAYGVGDPGTIWTGSSRGPCGDGRWKPNVCAVGQDLLSCQNGTTTGYVIKGGTSMSTPLVASMAAQLCDHYSFLRYNPSALSAVLMAGSLSKAEQTIDSPSGDATHLNSYGVGRVEAYKANYGSSQQALYFWSFNQSWTTGAVELDFTVNSGATRVTVVYHYKEAACSAGASQALINDIDMYLDAEPFTGASNSGDYVAQQSSVDNTEVRMVNSPPTGDWKIKLYPASILPFQTTHAGVCAIVTYADVTPTPTLNVTTNDAYINTGDTVTLTATYTNPEYFASGVTLAETSTAVISASYGTLIDGSTTDLMSNYYAGKELALGNVIHNSSRTHRWQGYWTTEGAKSFSVQARSDNTTDVTDAVTVYVDNTPPPLPTNLGSSTHTENVWTNDTTITYTWTQPADNVSGVDGYGIFTSSAPGLPGTTKDIEQVLSYAESLTQGTWYFMLRPVDNSGNWNASYASTGPYKIDTTAPTQPGVISSSSHTVNVQSCTTTVATSWAASSDALSGLAGYLGVWNTSAVFDPTGATNLAAGATSTSTNIGSSAVARYFHLRARDAVGNWGVTRHFGPVYANSNSVLSYCTAKTNSLGCLPTIGTNAAQPSKSAGTFTVTCTNVLNQKSGLLFWGASSSATPFQGGYKCVGNPTVRTVAVNSGGNATGNSCTGSYSFVFSTAYMNSVGLSPGDTVYAQWWMRDPASASTTGLSNAVTFTVCQ